MDDREKYLDEMLKKFVQGFAYKAPEKKEEKQLHLYEIANEESSWEIECDRILVNHEDYGNPHISCFIGDEIVAEFWNVVAWIKTI